MTPLILAKAPVPGQVKTRLGASVGDAVAADLAAAALLDTLDLCRDALGFGVVALAGDPAGDLALACRADELRDALAGWQVVPQEGASFAERIGNAHAAAGQLMGGPVVQVGMDTPHVAPAMLLDAAAELYTADGVIGPAEDGGWWVLGLNDPRHAALLRDVPTSQSDTGSLTLEALSREIVVAAGPLTYDVDTITEAARSAVDAPHTRFARAWSALERSTC